MKKKIYFLAFASCVGVSMSGTCFADGKQLVEPLEYKEKSTLETFHLKEIASDELSEAVIAGGLEPTSAGGQRNQPATVYEDITLIEPRDRQTDLGRYEIPVTINYREPRQVPGVTFGNDYAITPGPGNRVYNQHTTNLTER
ncbi:hypothetical protein [Alkalimarinus coralli]|uniref:hypothetical protein n=1 Tax=Alkalimarinus coralli TaxID=2935863 RepID=UPI00202AF1C1|nr:hypothetical protein [Alkalimarinus coralli]